MHSCGYDFIQLVISDLWSTSQGLVVPVKKYGKHLLPEQDRHEEREPLVGKGIDQE